MAVAVSTTTAEGGQRPNDLAAAITAPAPSHPLQIPAEFSSAAHTAPTHLQFPMTGAQVLARACQDEGVAALFCCPDNYAVVHALAGVGIPNPRNLPIELGIVSCAHAALEALADAMPPMTRAAWVAEIAAARRAFERQNDEYYRAGAACTDAVHPAAIDCQGRKEFWMRRGACRNYH